jgi:hypothetical protein
VRHPATVTRCYRVALPGQLTPVGWLNGLLLAIGIRGFRGYCEECGWLGPVRTNYITCRHDAGKHRSAP